MTTGTRTRTRLVAALTTTVIALGGLVATAAPASAQQVVVVQIVAGQNPTASVVISGSFTFSQSVPGGTAAHLTVTSCGQPILDTTQSSPAAFDNVSVWFSPDGQPDFAANSVNAKIGSSFEYVIDISEPGATPYSLSGSYSGYTVERPSCDEILSGSDSGGSKNCTITKPAKKLGQARVGRTVRVTEPRTTKGCPAVTYRWKADGRVVATTASLRLGPALKGKRLTALVRVGKVSRSGLSFGTVQG